MSGAEQAQHVSVGCFLHFTAHTQATSLCHPLFAFLLAASAVRSLRQGLPWGCFVQRLVQSSLAGVCCGAIVQITHKYKLLYTSFDVLKHAKAKLAIRASINLPRTKYVWTTFYGETAGYVEEGRKVGVIHPDFNKTFLFSVSVVYLDIAVIWNGWTDT